MRLAHGLIASPRNTGCKCRSVCRCPFSERLRIPCHPAVHRVGNPPILDLVLDFYPPGELRLQPTEQRRPQIQQQRRLVPERAVRPFFVGKMPTSNLSGPNLNRLAALPANPISLPCLAANILDPSTVSSGENLQEIQGSSIGPVFSAEHNPKNCRYRITDSTTLGPNSRQAIRPRSTQRYPNS